jgi:hypothetical protein
MGQEVACRARVGARSGSGTAYLETKELRFRGDFALKIAFAEMRGVKAADGTLIVQSPAGEAHFELGRYAEPWAQKILKPKSRIDKLGVKAGARVAVIGVDDAAFADELTARGIKSAAKPAAATDLIFYAADRSADLAKLAKLGAQLAPGGAIWVVSRKGKDATLKDIEVITAGRKAGLVDNKVVSFSDTHTALRFSPRKVERGA